LKWKKHMDVCRWESEMMARIMTRFPSTSGKVEKE
jgi:hypothetical protein